MSCLTAAWIAASRGHKVIVHEPSSAMGGMQRWRSQVPGQSEYTETISALEQRAAEAGVRFERGMPNDADFDTLWVQRRYRPGTAGPNGSYGVLAEDFTPAAGEEVTVWGRDLASAEAALLLAARDAHVTLRSPEADIAMDAHPGYRQLDRRLLNEHRAGVVSRSPAPAETTEGTLISGSVASTAAQYGAESAWDYPYGKPERADAFINDAYEPNLMTRGIYEAVELAVG